MLEIAVCADAGVEVYRIVLEVLWCVVAWKQSPRVARVRLAVMPVRRQVVGRPTFPVASRDVAEVQYLGLR